MPIMVISGANYSADVQVAGQKSETISKGQLLFCDIIQYKIVLLTTQYLVALPLTFFKVLQRATIESTKVVK